MSTYYSLTLTLEKLHEAKKSGNASITLYGIHRDCAARASELFEGELSLKHFKDNITKQPSATFTFKQVQI